MSTIGILLAGGQSSRFGSPKAFAGLDGKLFYEKVYEALTAACDHIVIVSRQEHLQQFPKHLDVITDLPEVAGNGPLAGIYSAMKMRPAEQYLVLPCDMPFVGPEETRAFLAAAYQNCTITAVRTKEDELPLFSLWSSAVLPELDRSITGGQWSVRKFLRQMDADWIASKRIHPDELVFRNINTSLEQKGMA